MPIPSRVFEERSLKDLCNARKGIGPLLETRAGLRDVLLPFERMLYAGTPANVKV
jgi:hypothetical protein